VVCAFCKSEFTPSTKKERQWDQRKTPDDRKFCSVRCSCKAPFRGEHLAAIRDSQRGNELIGAMGKHEQHMNAAFFCLRDPQRKLHVFRNLSNFIRSNPHLFDAIDTEWKSYKGKDFAPNACRARRGLGELFAISKRQNHDSWKGWVAVWKKDKLGKTTWMNVKKNPPSMRITDSERPEQG
jgi:hypothetical protein